jgi:O-antigen/teichoic acid export membrane protein
VLALLYGTPYVAAAPAFAFLMLTLPLLFITNLLGNCLGAVGRQRAVLAIAGANLLVNVGLNLVLIPRMDYAGAGLATLLTELCGFVMFAFVLRGDLRAMVAWPQLLGLAAANAALAVILSLLRAWPVAAVIAVGALAYLGIVVALRLLRFDELRLLMPASRGGEAA